MAYKKMEKKSKKTLVETLQSGKYTQGDSFLRRRIGGKLHYCCLGVLCNLEKNNKRWKIKLQKEQSYAYTGGELHKKTPEGLRDLSYFPHEKVLESSGLSVKAAQHLANMNDEGFTFIEIAAWIQKNL